MKVQATELRNHQERIEAELTQLASNLTLKDVVNTRLQAVHDTLAAVQANMIHNGAAGYVAGSVPSRKLREAYFFANLTPTVRHLEKIKSNFT